MSGTALEMDQKDKRPEANNNNNTKIVISTFKWEDKDCDMALCVGEYKYYAHSSVLAKESSVFERMLNGEWKESTDMFNIRLKETTICQLVFKNFVKYFYVTDEFNSLSLFNLQGMLLLANKYDVKGLLMKCTNYIGCFCLSDHVTCDSVTVVDLLTFLFENNFIPQYETVKAYVVKNFEDIFKDAPHVPPDVLIDLLGSSDIRIKSEEQLFGYVERWIQNLKLEMNFMQGLTASSYEETAAKILEQVRFYFISSEVVVQSDLCDQFGSILIGKLSQAAKVKGGKSNPNAEANEYLHTPRNYSNQEKSNPDITLRFVVENFSNLEKIYSPPTEYHNLIWTIMARSAYPVVTGKEKSLGFYIECESKNFLDSCLTWRFNAKIECRLLVQNGNTKPLIRKFEHIYTQDDNSRGYGNYVLWKDVLDKTNGYIKNDRIILEVCVWEKK